MRRRAQAPSISVHAAETKTARSRKARSLFGMACLCVLGLTAFIGSGAPSAGADETFPGQGFLPDNRAWELVSPPDKKGSDVVTRSSRTQAAADGSALKFYSLGAFVDAHGSGSAVEYLAQRSSAANPATNGWNTHAITPLQDPVTVLALAGAQEPSYRGELSSDLQSGVFFAYSPLSPDPTIVNVPNLYLRTDLRTPGAGNYQLLTQSETPLLPLSPIPFFAEPLNPHIAGASADFDHIIFESKYNLTADPPSSVACGPGFEVFFCPPRLYEWDQGTVRYAGILPDGTPADASLAGVGISNDRLTPHTISDGSDGHIRIFFTQPTNEEGKTISEEPFNNEIFRGGSGNLFVRVDHATTAKLNASERDTEPEDAFAPAEYLDASADGRRVFFKTGQALTDDAPVSGYKLYMYDAGRPASDPDNLTFISPDAEPDDFGEGEGLIGTSADGHYVYMLVNGQLLDGGPLNQRSIYLWHDGQITYIGPAPKADAWSEITAINDNWQAYARQARVSPDGRHLLFSTTSGAGLLSAHGGTDYDHGACVSGIGVGCREFYLYNADADTIACASCNPSGAPATAMASNVANANAGGTRRNWHQGHVLSDDGRFAFFSTSERLVAADTNGQEDAYVYDSVSGKPSLLSSGEDAAPSYFLDASADGHDAFFATRQRLSAWDVDGAYDVYDARVGGGFPEPRPAPPSCQGDACQPPPVPLNDSTPASAAFQGPGNPALRKPCPRGKRQVRTQAGKRRCAKRHHGHRRTADTNRRAVR